MNLIGFVNPQYSGYIQTFNGSPSSSWQRWDKPRGVTMVSIFCVGGGGGGGGGFTGAAGVARGGGGGGGSSGIQNLIVPGIMLPDTLYILAGPGGAAGPASGAGGTGGNSIVGTSVNANGSSNLRLAYSPGGNLGGAGTTTAPGAAGSGGSPALNTATLGSSLGVTSVNAGAGGSAGGAIGGAVGVAVTVGITTGIFTGGAGGGSTPAANTNFAGGAITGADFMPTQPGGLAAGGDGLAGVTIYPPDRQFFSVGGSGGGTNGAAGTGGAGGAGGIGCGGGGGGGGVTGGAGGAGGPGIVIIVCW